MPTMNMRQLRNTRQLESWLKAGETIELQKRNRLVARIVPIVAPAPKEKVWPNFEARHKKLFGNRVLNAVDDFIKNRHGRY
jgi:antitoxin (DNA-binding transcriptional repressor) of toxin-antitoxin stability system